MVIFEEPGILRIGSRKVCEQDVEVSIADTGTGIGDEHVDRLFNPLYTTKSEGLGMGLSICRSIIESHNGRLWVELNKPRGAIFHFSSSSSPREASLEPIGELG
jgi:signal transduction histidine kinase